MIEVSPALLSATVLEAFHAWMVRVRVDTMVREVARLGLPSSWAYVFFFQTGEMVVVGNEFCLEIVAKLGMIWIMK
jgi:hypothetical protein